MIDELWNERGPVAESAAPVPEVTDRATWQAQLDELLVREKAHTREGDAIAAARRRLPMVEVDGTIPLTGEHRLAPLLQVSRAAASSSRTSTCGTPASPRRTSARAARSATDKSATV